MTTETEQLKTRFDQGISNMDAITQLTDQELLKEEENKVFISSNY